MWQRVRVAKMYKYYMWRWTGEDKTNAPQTTALKPLVLTLGHTFTPTTDMRIKTKENHLPWRVQDGLCEKDFKDWVFLVVLDWCCVWSVSEGIQVTSYLSGSGLGVVDWFVWLVGCWLVVVGRSSSRHCVYYWNSSSRGTQSSSRRSNGESGGKERSCFLEGVQATTEAGSLEKSHGLQHHHGAIIIIHWGPHFGRLLGERTGSCSETDACCMRVSKCLLK